MVHSLSFLEPGALCGVWFHVAARGIDLKDIFLEDAHRRHWLELLEEWVHRFRLRLHTYARMSNHYHLLLETPQANLSQASSGCRPVTACGLTAKEAYRRYVEEAVREGLPASPWEEAIGGLVLGRREFLAKAQQGNMLNVELNPYA